MCIFCFLGKIVVMGIDVVNLIEIRYVKLCF